MMNDIKVVFFDLFYTLVTPKYNDLRNENDVLGITKTQWESYAEDNELYLKRATGKEKSPQKIIGSIVDKIRITVSECEKKEILKLREERFKKSLIDVDFTILDVLLDIKKSGKKICLLSNADIMDVMHWDKSPLNNLFDDTIFSYEVGYLKPQPEIYKIALKKMNVNPKKCIFIGDGGSDELKGAKELGIKTILTGYLLKRDQKQHNIIKKFADYYIEDFKEIKNILFQ
ncbi:HAD-IA family hydrolase [Clostridium tagluense]|uniref:HAD family hydrolase n=1 Tax=Clostridium tagluense TaxID=360422 RepID=UPI001CF4D623|nr:HAD-IA family hydrolase [Clostridium tagluense]MCB2314119.1 HAD-IA family hydrolase [Clostridium tagluense]MCB2318961.1 HAD-IA family hydrolase [Clostridium tagluense]MCB2323851.1 HAD-IA family hydrolase [Clostridium tagluense]MCB2328692.1 HAD-IA family hydrolase [Clostridium tagluense]MCB2333576.1 HAD-IA family hydrolase [Clostridium tagluense]